MKHLRLSSHQVFFLLVCLLSLLGGVVVVYATSNGAWGRSDAVAYLATARSLARGDGLGFEWVDGTFRVMTHYPPFYPMLLAVFYWMGGDLLAVPRWLDVFLLVGSVFGAGYLFLRFSRSPWSSLLASLLVGCFPPLVRMSHSAMSEPLFLFLLIWGIYALLAYLRTDRIAWFAAAVILTGLLPATRYIGIFMIPAAALALLLLSKGGWKKRLGRALLFGVLASLPLLFWAGWVYLALSQNLGGRAVAAGAGRLVDAFQLFASLVVKTIWEWLPFNPYYPATKSRLRMVLLLAVAMLMLAGVLLAVRRRRDEVRAGMDFELYVLSSLGWVSFGIFLFLSYLLTSPAPDIDDRMLLPVYIFLVFATLAAFACWQAAWFHGKWRSAGLLPWALALVFLFWHLPQTRYVIAEDRLGWGEMTLATRHSQVLPAAQALPVGQQEISNDATKILLWADRPAYDLWAALSPAFVAASGPYGSDPADPLQQMFCQDRVALVLVGSWEAQMEALYGQAGRDRVASLLAGLYPAGEYADGAIYYCQP